ncbi:putative signal transducing protein [Marinifilum sp. D737]|jgi:hypothetical protein|uniref:putative signal transducing protein n=1 Tax=Marinifilum sp. D737 TaxID=2969628 RepID=UPI00227362AF|nr:DUF2007 domain-containing protein [Marinifilum sp. D737]MCY1636521.1 DUF2007 domain-containing protein [Marinifilum sp. D737]
MTDGNNLVCVFTGSLVDVKYYKERLEEVGIPSLWKDEFSSGTLVGMGGTPDNVDLFVDEEHEAKARNCIASFQED